MHDSPPPPALFRPVPMLRKRHDGWTPARQELFLIYLEQIGIVSAAAKAVGMSAKSAYALYNRSEAEQIPPPSADETVPSFAEAWQLALDIGRDNARHLAISRAIDGEARPVFYRGRQVGERTVYDNRLLGKALQLAMKAREPVDPGALNRFLNGEK
jgi:hypothetical protein